MISVTVSFILTAMHITSIIAQIKRIGLFPAWKIHHFSPFVFTPNVFTKFSVDTLLDVLTNVPGLIYVVYVSYYVTDLSGYNLRANKDPANRLFVSVYNLSNRIKFASLVKVGVV